MNAYLAIIFAKKIESQSYFLEVSAAIKLVAGNNLKRGADMADMLTIAFLSEKDSDFICKSFRDLWRNEQRTWVVPLDSPVLIDKAIMDWVRKATAKA